MKEFIDVLLSLPALTWLIMGAACGAAVLALRSQKISPEHGLLAWLSTSFVGLVAAKMLLFVAKLRWNLDLTEIGWCVAAITGFLGNYLLLAADLEGKKMSKNPFKYVTTHLASWLETAAAAIKPTEKNE